MPEFSPISLDRNVNDHCVLLILVVVVVVGC